MTAPSKFNKVVPHFLLYKNGPNMVESLLGTIGSYAENPSIFSKIVLGLILMFGKFGFNPTLTQVGNKILGINLAFST